MARFIIKWFLILLLVSISGIVAIFFFYSAQLPDYSQLAKYNPPAVTRIYTSDGKLIEEYAKEYRMFVPIESIPKSLINAFLAAEDKNFYDHQGVDILAIIKAFVRGLLRSDHKLGGASTITQQVVKNLLLTSERSIARKIKEAILSYRISKVFTKEQVLELYLNHIFFGDRAYGVAAAAQRYFNKSINELTIEEAALLVGMPQAPSRFNPHVHLEAALQRRNYVIDRMLSNGSIGAEAAEAALRIPILLKKRDVSETITAGYFAEEVRQKVIEMYDEDFFYTKGLTIITSLNSADQVQMEKLLRNALKKYDANTPYRGPIKNIPIENYKVELKYILGTKIAADFLPAVVVEVLKATKSLRVQLDNDIINIDIKNFVWEKGKSKVTDFKTGDVILLAKQGAKYKICQIPKINGGMTAMNYTTGQITAMVGGYSYDMSKFNRVTKAQRQTGSLIKSFVYLAALEAGIEPNTIFNDGPIAISQGPGMPAWKPKNYAGDFLGDITMRTGLEKSRNLVTIRVAQAVGIKKIGDMINRFDISDISRRYFAMVLGATESTLLQMTAAYGALANLGRKVTPSMIELIQDTKGNVIYRRANQNCGNSHIQNEIPVIETDIGDGLTDEASAYQITSILKGATHRGTSGAAGRIGKVLAGKTGTTNDSMDVWYVGYSSIPQTVVGVYLGYDYPKTLGSRASGATLALPVFVDYMTYATKDFPAYDFPIPDNIKIVSVDRHSGAIGANSDNMISEALKVHAVTQKLAHDELEIDQEDLDIFAGRVERQDIEEIDRSNMAKEKLRNMQQNDNDDYRDSGEVY